jgi:hypothetical protein
MAQGILNQSHFAMEVAISELRWIIGGQAVGRIAINKNNFPQGLAHELFT